MGALRRLPRSLDSRTVPDSYPLPHIRDFTAYLCGAAIFSETDLFEAYHQTPVVPEHIIKTDIVTPFGLLEYLPMLLAL